MHELTQSWKEDMQQMCRRESETQGPTVYFWPTLNQAECTMNHNFVSLSELNSEISLSSNSPHTGKKHIGKWAFDHTALIRVPTVLAFGDDDE